MNLPDYDDAIHFDKWVDSKGIEQEADFKETDDVYGESLGIIYLTGGGLVERAFKGTATDSKYGWQEFTWKKSPSRDASFSFSNMDSIDVGLVARCAVSYKYMNIKDYMDLRKIVGRERHFYVKFFDIDDGAWVEREMYCSKEERTKLFTLGKSLIGVSDLSVEFVGTNNDIEETSLSINYFDSDGNELSSLSKTGLSEGNQVKIASYSSIKGWSTTSGSSTINYKANQSTTIWKNLNLYAVLE